MADDEKSGEADKIKKPSDFEDIKDVTAEVDDSADVEALPDGGPSAVEAVPGEEAEDAEETSDADIIEGDDGAASTEAVPNASDEDTVEGVAELTDVGDDLSEIDLTQDEEFQDPEPLEDGDDTYDPTPFEDPEPPQSDDFTPADATAPAATAVAPVTHTVVKKGGFWPLLLGGVAAAVVGFVAARYVVPEGWPFPGVQTEEDPFVTDTLAMLENHGAAIADLDARVGATEGKLSGFDPEAVTAQASEAATTATGTAEQLDALSGNLDTLEQRLTALEKRPIEESVSPEAIQAYERELEAMRSAMQTQREEIQTMISDATAKEDAANETERLTMIRAALSEISGALTEGAPFADAVTQLQEAGAEVPQALSDVAGEGVSTQAELAELFPSASRAALSAARSSGAADEGGSRLTSFFREQLGARSVVPKEGNDADAILSRADAAQRSGDYDAALAEIETLPDPAREALSVWTAQAQARRDAVVALEAASQELNTQ